MSYINVISYDPESGGQLSGSFIQVDECPLCGFGIKPVILNSFYVSKNQNQNGFYCTPYVLHLCPKCHGIFLVEYATQPIFFGPASSPVFPQIARISPTIHRQANFSDEIASLSPAFVETYTQSSVAESEKLFQICGIGYRKALEFLVKDYLCHIHPEDSEKIQSEFLGSSIQRINDQRIKVLAERSTWIGNDETHYVRKQEDLGVEDMKRFIKAMLTYIESELAFEAAEAISQK